MKTSIVLLALNNLNLTIRCIESIRMHTNAAYEIIAVDNGSVDSTASWLSAQPDVTLIANSFNRGFAAACNQAAAAASGDVLLLLNNDTIVSPGWLNRLLTSCTPAATSASSAPNPTMYCPSKRSASLSPARQTFTCSAAASTVQSRPAGKKRPASAAFA